VAYLVAFFFACCVFSAETLSLICMNKLYYGDNLAILREYLPNDSVDLIYLDPPFNSNRNYNVLFKDEAGKEAESQITAFEDTWHWNASAEQNYRELILRGDEVGKMIESFRSFIGENQMMAYLVMMAIRLTELHRVLKDTGSLYLHCDPTASHYLKILLDTVFGADNFHSEVIWKRTSSHNSAKRFGPIHDVIFFYSKTDDFVWNNVYQPYDETYIKDFYRYEDEKGKFRLSDLTGAGTRNGETGKPWRGINPTDKGRHWSSPPSVLDEFDKQGRIYFPPKGLMPSYKRYLAEMSGMSAQDVITDIQPLSAQSAERLGYPTQKPVKLLERILQASSNEGDVVLDPFCGCGTTIAAAHKLNRNWIGIDITQLSIALQKYRLQDSFQLTAKKDYEVIGEPQDLQSAKALANDDRYQFQWWALSLIKARPLGASSGSKVGKKGSDKGIDGVMTFLDDNSGKAKRVLVQVKSGKVKSGDIRDLRGTIERENAEIGVFITLETSTRDMNTEAVSAGFYHSEHWNRDYPKLQIFSIEDLLNGKEVQMPLTLTTFKQAEKIGKDADQGKLF
jgi:site-specific DNA-methyltransferase (adenine-specific)